MSIAAEAGEGGDLESRRHQEKGAGSLCPIGRFSEIDLFSAHGHYFGFSDSAFEGPAQGVCPRCIDLGRVCMSASKCPTQA